MSRSFSAVGGLGSLGVWVMAASAVLAAAAPARAQAEPPPDPARSSAPAEASAPAREPVKATAGQGDEPELSEGDVVSTMTANNPQLKAAIMELESASWAVVREEAAFAFRGDPAVGGADVAVLVENAAG